MTINIHNYEEFALDYLEGSLPEPTLSAFNQFLDKHPDLRAEINGMETLNISESDLGPIPLFKRKEELYKEAALVNLLKKTVYVKLWQIAAAFILLISSLWVINSYYLEDHSSAAPILANIERITPKVETKDDYQVGRESIPNEQMALESRIINTNEKEIIQASAEHVQSEAQMRYHRENEIELATQTEMEILQTLMEDELIKDLQTQEEDRIPTERQMQFATVLPVNQMMLEIPSEPLDIATQEILWNPVFIEAIEDELHTRRFFAKLAERMLPDQITTNLTKLDLNFNTDRIPVEFLPKIIQQQSN